MPDLRALLSAASSRPWRVIMPGDTTWGARRKYRCVSFDKQNWYATSPLNIPDARIIVAAVNALPALLDVVEAAQVYIRDAYPSGVPGGLEKWQALDLAVAKLEATDGR